MNINGKFNKEELETLILEKNLSYREIGRMYNVSDTYIKKICIKLDIKLPKRANFPPNWIPHNKHIHPKNCKNCSKHFISTYSKAIFCSMNCFHTYTTNQHYSNYLNNQDGFCGIRKITFVKPFILKDQNNSCDLCGIKNEWNNKKLVFVLDHIDGDASNNKRTNLRLICPNCDSQLDTFKSKNKNSARKERYLLNYK
jgi:protein-arginine kinase activator protein McsA